jgi:arginine decarboxylase
VAREVKDLSKEWKHAPDEMRNLSKMLATNISAIFAVSVAATPGQSINCSPSCRFTGSTRNLIKATLQDITCDSDNKIDHFIGTRNFSVSSRARTDAGRTYYLAVFMIGAYGRFWAICIICSAIPMWLVVLTENGEYSMKNHRRKRSPGS